MLRDRFNLQAEPFRLTPDLRFFFDSPAHGQAARGLLAAVRGGSGVILVTGPAGSGKTLLLRWLTRELGEQAPVALVWASALDFDELLSAICVQFGLPDAEAGRAERLRAIASLARSPEARPPVLLLDEADALSDDALRDLPQLTEARQEGMAPVTLVMAAGEAFQARLEGSLGAKIGREYRLSPLARDRVGDYVRHQLRVAGYAGGELFSAEALDRLAVLSRGVPRLINGICARALLALGAGQGQQVTADLVDEVAHEVWPVSPEPMPLSEAPTTMAQGKSPPYEGGDLEGVSVEEPSAVDTATAAPVASGPEGLSAVPARARRPRQATRKRVAVAPASARGKGRRLRTLALIGCVMLPVGLVAIVAPPEGEVPSTTGTETVSLPLPPPTVQRADTGDMGPGLGKAPPAAPPVRRMEQGGVPAERAVEPAREAAPAVKAASAPRGEGVPADVASSKVARAQFARGIANREPVGAVGPVIAAAGIGRLFFFTDLRGLGGETVTHRWEHDGQRVSEVRFQVRGDAWRVYSRKDLSPSMTGPWRVLVLDSGGKVLASRSFVYKRR